MQIKAILLLNYDEIAKKYLCPLIDIINYIISIILYFII